jgi:hypothetical protein
MHIAGVTIHLPDGTTSAEVVEEADISPGLPPSTYDANLRVLLRSFAISPGTALTAETATTFQGKAAREGQFSVVDRSPLTVLAVMDGPNRIYMLSAPAGAPFDVLAASLVVLP